VMSDGHCDRTRFSKTEAKRVLRRQRSLPGSTAAVVYRCGRCGGWHLSSEPTRDPRALSAVAERPVLGLPPGRKRGQRGRGQSKGRSGVDARGKRQRVVPAIDDYEGVNR
jgi:hypothetical protein